MTKLNQWLAIETGRKARLNQVITNFYHQLQKTALYTGLERTYLPREVSDDQSAPVEVLPSESQRVQINVETALRSTVEVMAELFDVVLTKDVANTVAKGSVVVDGETLLADVPVTHLLFLEKQLTDLLTILSKVPTLDRAYVWDFDPTADAWRWHEPVKTIRTQRRPQVLVRYPATDKHPAQTEVFQEDVAVGTWIKTELSGAMSAFRVRELIDRTRKLLEAVKFAREDANSMNITEQHAGERLLNYVFSS